MLTGHPFFGPGYPGCIRSLSTRGSGHSAVNSLRGTGATFSAGVCCGLSTDSGLPGELLQRALVVVVRVALAVVGGLFVRQVDSVVVHRDDAESHHRSPFLC